MSIIILVIIAGFACWALGSALSGYQDEIDGYENDLKEWEEDQKKRGL